MNSNKWSVNEVERAAEYGVKNLKKFVKPATQIIDRHFKDVHTGLALTGESRDYAILEASALMTTGARLSWYQTYMLGVLVGTITTTIVLTILQNSRED